ncbi:MAG TPA: radical SAM protein [Rhodobacteraceae bacterium]|jgi:hypothetical protein|nr:radical SAM protein [Paracoccaceae bacterium]
MKHQVVKQVENRANIGKFEHPFITAKGETRASVPLSKAETLWFNTGTLCNISCVNCYIDSSPFNNLLVYFTADDVQIYLDQIIDRKWPVREIGFTGGEPYMNPQMNAMSRLALEADYEVLVLTNAMRPMMRSRIQAGIAELVAEFGDKLTFRVSLDHYSQQHHDEMRGAGAFEKTIAGMDWLNSIGAKMSVAGRMLWGESQQDERDGFAKLFEQRGYKIDAMNPGTCVLFPEMDETVEVPEITTACWGILGKSPSEIMCAGSRMVVRRKGADHPVVLACTLLPYAKGFEMGATLKEAERDVYLNHAHCAKFCVLGGASCSA